MEFNKSNKQNNEEIFSIIRKVCQKYATRKLFREADVQAYLYTVINQSKLLNSVDIIEAMEPPMKNFKNKKDSQRNDLCIMKLKPKEEPIKLYLFELKSDNLSYYLKKTENNNRGHVDSELVLQDIKKLISFSRISENSQCFCFLLVFLRDRYFKSNGKSKFEKKLTKNTKRKKNFNQARENASKFYMNLIAKINDENARLYYYGSLCAAYLGENSNINCVIYQINAKKALNVYWDGIKSQIQEFE